MSLLPLLYSHWWDELEHPHSLYDQDFGHGIHPETLIPPRSLLQLPHYAMANRRPTSSAALASRCPVGYNISWPQHASNVAGGVSTVNPDKDQFHVTLDVKQFAPEEINVKVVDKWIVVEGKHEDKQDEHGFISRQFTRRYLVPEQCDIEHVVSKLSSDGVLAITVPRKDQPKIEGERKIPIQHTGQPAVNHAPPANPKPVENKANGKS